MPNLAAMQVRELSNWYPFYLTFQPENLMSSAWLVELDFGSRVKDLKFTVSQELNIQTVFWCEYPGGWQTAPRARIWRFGSVSRSSKVSDATCFGGFNI